MLVEKQFLIVLPDIMEGMTISPVQDSSKISSHADIDVRDL